MPLPETQATLRIYLKPCSDYSEAHSQIMAILKDGGVSDDDVAQAGIPDGMADQFKSFFDKSDYLTLEEKVHGKDFPETSFL